MATPSASASAPQTPLEEWRANWGVLLSAFVGVSFGAVPGMTLGLFMEPLEDEFHWSRAMISGGMMIFAVIGIFIGPPAGALLDRIGSRRCVLPGLFFCAITFGSFGLMTGPAWQWWAIWVCYSLASLLARSVVWNAAISRDFSLTRGLAISFVLSGFGIAQIVAPWIAHALISGFSWRTAYLILGLGWPGAAFILAMLLFQTRRSNRKPGQPAPDVVAERSALGGLTLGEAVRDPAILRIAVSTILTIGISGSLSVHLVPMLDWAGLDHGVAAGLAGLTGLGALAGNFGAGWLTDKVGGSFVPATVYGIPALGLLLIWQGGVSPVVVGAGVFCVGFAFGGSLQMATYLTTRYAGLRHFGKIFGLITSGIAFSAGVGPLLTGRVYDASHSYALFFMVAIPAALVSGLTVVGLGPYRDFTAAGNARPTA